MADVALVEAKLGRRKHIAIRSSDEHAFCGAGYDPGKLKRSNGRPTCKHIVRYLGDHKRGGSLDIIRA